MTESIKTLIDKLPISRVGFGDEMRDLLYKEDVEKMVEAITKWNKVEDGMPKKGSRVLVKHIDENVHLCLCLDGVTFIDPDDYIAWCNVIEWKYIN